MEIVKDIKSICNGSNIVQFRSEIHHSCKNLKDRMSEYF